MADKKSFTLNAEFSSPEVRTLTSATIHQLQQSTYTHPSFKRVVVALTSGDQHLESVIPLNRQELLGRLNPSAICGTDL